MRPVTEGHLYLAGLLRKGWFPVDKAGETLLPDVKGDRLALAFDSEKLSVLASAVRPALDSLTRSMRRRESTDHLKQIGLGMHNYADAKKRFPPAAIAGAKGQPLLSWRVAILPYLGEEALFKEFHLDEPWDSKHNHKLIDRMPAVYRSHGSVAENGQTSYVVAVGPGSVFDGPAGVGFGQIPDGSANTTLAFETGDERAVIWTKPVDHAFDPKHPAEGLASPYSDGLLTLFCDGSVHFLKQPIDEETLRRLIIRNDGLPVSP